MLRSSEPRIGFQMASSERYPVGESPLYRVHRARLEQVRQALKTLKSKFVLIVCAAYLVLGALTLLAFHIGSEGIVETVGVRFAEKYALLQKNKILSILEREVALTLKMANDPVFREWYENREEPDATRRACEQLESYRKVFRNRSYFIALSATNKHYTYNPGEQRLESTTLSESNPADKWFFKTLNTVETFTLNVAFDCTVMDTKIWINAILRDANGRKIGVCGSGLNITDYIDDFVLRKDTGVSAIIVDRRGVIQAHEDRKYVDYNASVSDEAVKVTIYNLMERQEDREALIRAMGNLALDKVEVETFPIVINGEKYFASVTCMKDLSWFIIILFDASEAAKMADFMPIAATVVLSLLLMSCIIAFMLNRVVLRPLSTLTEASGRVARGEYDTGLSVTRADEIGRLTEAFNVMTSTVLDQTRNLENKVAERTSELKAANGRLQEAQEQFMESVRYAKMVQSCLLPNASLFDRYVKDRFILQMPRDVVGGDFYYFRGLQDAFILAVIDCTGHGIPGALITMPVNAVFNCIPDSLLLEGPDRALFEVNHLIRNTLHYDTSNHLIDSGVDLGLCLCFPERKKVVFAGAGLSLYCFDGREVREIRGDRKRLGYERSDAGTLYTSHEISTTEEMRFYLSSDGILDQPGGESGFGLGRERLKEMIGSVAKLPMSEQEDALRRGIDGYRGPRPQRDDILVIGFALSGGKPDA